VSKSSAGKGKFGGLLTGLLFLNFKFYGEQNAGTKKRKIEKK